jgi:hypothetical protein
LPGGADAADPATKEALRDRTALHRGSQSLNERPLCTASAVEICRTLKAVDMDIRRTAGSPSTPPSTYARGWPRSTRASCST